MSFVLLKTFGNYIEASMAVSMLQQEGINCHIEDENIVTIINMASGIRLMVYQSQAGRALEILADAELAYLKDLPCPRCKHAGFEIKITTVPEQPALSQIPFGRFFAFFSRMLSPENAVIREKHYVCLNCHTEFDELPSWPV